MQVFNEQPCTLRVGPVRIGHGETKRIPATWHKRADELAGLGAMRVVREPGDPPAEAGPQIDATKAGPVKPGEIADTAAHKAAIASGQLAEVKPADPLADFATWHHNRATAWVRKCNDRELLELLATDEVRESVHAAITARIEQLDSQT